MKKTLLIATLFSTAIACQKEITPVETNISSEKVNTFKQSVANDPMLLESCQVSVKAQDLVAIQVSKYNFKATDLQKIDFKKITSQSDYVNALKSVGFQDAEQYVGLRKQQESLIRQLHQKYPDLAKISLPEWNEIVGEGMKKVYASMGRTYYGIPSKAN